MRAYVSIPCIDDPGLGLRVHTLDCNGTGLMCVVISSEHFHGMLYLDDSGAEKLIEAIREAQAARKEIDDYDGPSDREQEFLAESIAAREEKIRRDLKDAGRTEPPITREEVMAEYPKALIEAEGGYIPNKTP